MKKWICKPTLFQTAYCIASCFSNLTAFAQEETNTEQTAPAGVTVQEDVEEGSGEPQTPDSETVTDGETDANSEVSTNSETDANSEVSTNSETDANSEVTTDGETASGANGADRNPDAGEQVFNITPPLPLLKVPSVDSSSNGTDSPVVYTEQTEYEIATEEELKTALDAANQAATQATAAGETSPLITIRLKNDITLNDGTKTGAYYTLTGGANVSLTSTEDGPFTLKFDNSQANRRVL